MGGFCRPSCFIDFASSAMPSLSSRRACASRQTVISLTGISRRRYAIADWYDLRGARALRLACRAGARALRLRGAAARGRRRAGAPLAALRAPLADFLARANGAEGAPFYLKSDWLVLLD